MGYFDTKGQDQAQRRRVQTFFDQHGRGFRGSIEIKTGDPVSMPTVVTPEMGKAMGVNYGCKPPWLPHLKFLTRPDLVV